MVESKEKKYILWLPSWYPNELTPYDGDFIQRHARAVAPLQPVHVFHIIRDRQRKWTRSTRLVEKVQGPLTETILYYASPNLPIASLDKLVSQWKFMWHYRRYLRKLFGEKGFPDLVHVHVVYKAGLIGRWIRKKWGIPFVLTEQWTLHLPEAKPNLFDLSYAEQHLISRIMDHAEWVLPVSQYLGEAMKEHWPHIRLAVVPNVVDHTMFKPGPPKAAEGTLRLIHISTLSYQKDPESLVTALSLLQQRGVDFTLDLFGPISAEISGLFEKSGIQQRVRFHGEKPQSVLAPILAAADALILYSRYETFGCVLIEAHACGVPVVVPDTPLMREIIEPEKNGWLVAPHDPVALADTLEKIGKREYKMDPALIRESSLKFSLETIGKQYVNVYETILAQEE